MKISVCGKGGSGKSTVVALLAGAARAKGYRVLVVDADESNSGLFRMLGFDHPPVPLVELVGGKKSLRQRMGQPAVLAESSIAQEIYRRSIWFRGMVSRWSVSARYSSLWKAVPVPWEC